VSALKKQELTALLNHAVRAARAAGHVIRRHYLTELKVLEKKGAGLVTRADIEAERAAIRVLACARKDFGFLGEEGTKNTRQSKPGRWILDPLDGTTNFVHGFPMFCVSIAAEWEQQTVLGVIYHPVLKELYTAVRGQGAYLNGKRISVSRTRHLDDALLTTGFTYKKELLHGEMSLFERLSQRARAVRRPGSAALDLAYTARGVFDGFWEKNLAPWDVAAGALLVEEAGGVVTHFDGAPFQVDGREILAAPPGLHAELRGLLKPRAPSKRRR
jgi:myo-inositol-1(or 4)-monophosphatase